MQLRVVSVDASEILKLCNLKINIFLKWQTSKWHWSWNRGTDEEREAEVFVHFTLKVFAEAIEYLDKQKKKNRNEILKSDNLDLKWSSQIKKQT